MGKASTLIVTASVALIVWVYGNPEVRQLLPGAFEGGIAIAILIAMFVTAANTIRSRYFRHRFGTDDRGFPVTNGSRPSWRLNGWQRLGVILSGLWLVFSVGLVTHVYVGDESSSWFLHEEPAPAPRPAPMPARKSSGAFDDLVPATPSQLPAQAAGKQNEFDRMFEDIAPVPTEEWARSLKIDRCLIFLLAPIVLGWIAAYATVWAVAWVRAGFSETRAKTKPPRATELRD